jgi:hypothetical protein
MPLPTVAQGVGVVAVLVGLFLALPLYGAVLASGVLVFLLGVAAEVAVSRAHGAPSRGGGGSTDGGGA